MAEPECDRCPGRGLIFQPCPSCGKQLTEEQIRASVRGDRLASAPRALSRPASQGSRDEPTGQGASARRHAIPIVQRLMIVLCALWILFDTFVDVRDVQRKALRTDLAACSAALADAGAEADAAHARGLAEGRLDGLNEAADIRRAAEIIQKALDEGDSYPMDEVHPR